jgi:hypothetical protein
MQNGVGIQQLMLIRSDGVLSDGILNQILVLVLRGRSSGLTWGGTFVETEASGHEAIEPTNIASN